MQHTITTRKISHNVTIEVPYGSTILQVLTVGEMNHNYWPSARVVINTTGSYEMDKWRFIVVGEGEQVPDGFEYVGSVVHPGNPKDYSHWAVSLPQHEVSPVAFVLRTLDNPPSGLIESARPLFEAFKKENPHADRFFPFGDFLLKFSDFE